MNNKEYQDWQCERCGYKHPVSSNIRPWLFMFLTRIFERLGYTKILISTTSGTYCHDCIKGINGQEHFWGLG